MKKKRPVLYTIKLSNDLREALRERAKAEDRPMSSVVRNALRKALLNAAEDTK